MSPIMVGVIAVVTIFAVAYIAYVIRDTRSHATPGGKGYGQITAVKIVVDSFRHAEPIHYVVIRDERGRRIDSRDVPDWLLDHHVYQGTDRIITPDTINLRAEGPERRHAAAKVRRGGYLFELAAPIKVHWTCLDSREVHWAVDEGVVAHTPMVERKIQGKKAQAA